MLDYFKPVLFWIGGSLLVLFKYITLENLVLIVQLIAFILTIIYTLWKWFKDKRRTKNQIPNVQPWTPEVKNNGRKRK